MAGLIDMRSNDPSKKFRGSIDSSIGEYDKRTVSLIGRRFWTSKEVIELCERLSGKTAKISYIPGIGFSILRRFFRFFEFTWNISDRLQFGEIVNDKNASMQPTNEISWVTDRLSLESYLQDYFGKILKKLREKRINQESVFENPVFGGMDRTNWFEYWKQKFNVGNLNFAIKSHKINKKFGPTCFTYQ